MSHFIEALKPDFFRRKNMAINSVQDFPSWTASFCIANYCFGVKIIIFLHIFFCKTIARHGLTAFLWRTVFSRWPLGAPSIPKQWLRYMHSNLNVSNSPMHFLLPVKSGHLGGYPSIGCQHGYFQAFSYKKTWLQLSIPTLNHQWASSRYGKAMITKQKEQVSLNWA